MMNAADLADFESAVAAEFNAGKIPYPVHLESGNEDALIEIFQEVKPADWVFVSWRGHLKALLKGVPREDLTAAIRRGESMALRFPEHRVYGSAIVGGTVPIALGVALALKRVFSDAWVWCFLGDMTAETGGAHEAIKYASNHDLPITWIIEDNGVSVLTNTSQVWGCASLFPHVRRYKYRSKYPHAGAGTRVEF